MSEAEEKAVEYLKANSLVRLNENNEVVAYGNAHKYYIINLIKKLQKENEELKNKVVIRDNDIIYLEETAEKEFITKQEVKENYIQKAKIKEKLEELENEEKALRKDFEKHRVQLFELYKKVVLIEGYKKLLEEEK